MIVVITNNLYVFTKFYRFVIWDNLKKLSSACGCVSGCVALVKQVNK